MLARRHASLVAAVVAVGAVASPVVASVVATPAGHPLASPGTAHVVVIAVPDLRWADVAQMPQLRAFAATHAVADLSVRTQPLQTRCAGGALAFGSSGRTQAVGTSCAVDAVAFAAARKRNRDDRFGARLGLLGDALHAAGLRTAAVGAGSVPLVADSSYRVDVVGSDLRSIWPAASVVAEMLPDLYDAPATSRSSAARRVDEQIALTLRYVPPTATVIVAGISDGRSGGAHVHALVVAGPGWPAGRLSSGSTRRVPWVQVVDLAPTVLAALRLPIPDEMLGSPVKAHRGHVPSQAALADDDRHARAASTVKFWTITLTCLAALLGLLAWRFLGRGAGLVRAAVAVPALSYLAQLLPWWRWSTSAFLVLLAAAAAVVGWLVGLLARRNVVAGALLVPAITAVLLLGDQLVRAPLELSAPLGDNPLVAGRFHGMSNIPFALAGAAALLVAAVVGGVVRRRTDSRRAAVAIAVGIALVAAAIDGAPGLGADFGGLLTLPAAVVVLAVVLAGGRLDRRRLALALGAGIVAAVAVALLDYSRPKADQTHLGRFVGSVLHHGGGRVIWRKADLVLHSFGNIAVTLLLVAVVVVAVSAGREGLRRWSESVPGLDAGWAAVATLAVIGSLVNDSGAFVAAMATLAGLLPALIAAPQPGAPGLRGILRR